MAGVFITKGMTVGLPVGTDLFSGSISLVAHYDVCPTWLNISMSHLRDARMRRDDRDAAWQSEDDETKAKTLEAEFQSSMQAIVASAIAVDAFYAVVKDKAGLASTRGRGSRPAQVSETIKQVFGLPARGFAVLRQNADAIYKLRDLAVHPKGSLGDTIAHPELGGIGVEWRFFYFRYTEALKVVHATVGMLNDLASNGKAKNKALRDYMAALLTTVAPLAADEIFSTSPLNGPAKS